MVARDAIEIAGTEIRPGRRVTVDIPVARLPTTDSWMSLPIAVVNGRRAGPRLFLSAVIHGDELNGIEIIRRVVEGLDARTLVGTVVAIPVINVLGLVERSRYLPDRRDLNRSFPGSPRGSLAARLAHIMMTEVVSQCAYGVDFHTGSLSRNNLPHIRADLGDPETLALAKTFAAPVMVDSRTRDGSLREAATARGCRLMVYEGGEPNRFGEHPIRVGVDGTRRVLKALGMIDEAPRPQHRSVLAEETSWVRARRGGLFRLQVDAGDTVAKGEVLGEIGDALGTKMAKVAAPHAGIVIGANRDPVVHQGDALIHLAVPVAR